MTDDLFTIYPNSKAIENKSTMEELGIKELKARLFALLQKEALKKGKFVLSSGRQSSYYLDGRVITLTPEGAILVASLILEMIKGRGIDAVGGPTLGADPIVGAVAVLSHIKNIPLKTFIVRKKAKEALDKEGLVADTAVVIVDRGEGAALNLAGAGLKLEPIFKISDFGL